MLNAGFQYLEQRDANDTITKDGVVGKNSPFATSDNSGIYDIIAEDLRWLKENVDDVKDTSDLEAIKQSVTDMYNEMKNDSSFGEAAAKAQAEEAKKQAQAALESATNAKTYRDDVVAKSTEANDTLAEIKSCIDKAEKLNASNKELEQTIADYATVASNKANEASTSATNAATSETNAKISETAAKASETASKTSETNAKQYEAEAKAHMDALATGVSNAKASETASKLSETNAKTSEVNAKASEVSAKTYETNASNSAALSKKWAESSDSPDSVNDTDSTTGKTQSSKSWALYARDRAISAYSSESNAKASETASKTSETNAKTSETNAAKSASNAKTSESAARTSETNAKASETAAKTSEDNASTSKSNAAASESNAKSYMDTAKEYMQKAQEALAAAQAIQSIVDTAKANAEKCLADVEAVRDSLSKMITYQGSVDNYSDLPTNPQVGYSYNVKNADKEHGVNAGDNLVWNGTDWDNFGSYVDMSLFAELGKDVKFNTVTATLIGNAATATKLASPRTISLSGKAAGSTTFDGSSNAAINVTSVNADTASKLSTAHKINITGDATGAAAFDGSSDANISVTVNESKHAAAATKLASPRTISLSGKAAGSTTFDGSSNAAINVTSVNADTASKLSTAHKINITGDATGAAAFDGSSDANISVTVNESKHAAAATTVNATAPNGGAADLAFGTMAVNDYARIRVYGKDDNGALEIATADAGTEPIYARQYRGSYDWPNGRPGKVVNEAAILDSNGNTKFPKNVTAASFTGPLNGNAGSARLISPFEIATANVFRNVWFSDSDTSNKACYSPNIQYNPSTNVLKVGTVQGTLNGNATTATTATKANGLTGSLNFPNIGDVATSNKISWSGSTDGADIYYQTTASDQGNLVLNLRDDANCYLRIACNGAFKSYFSPSDGNFHGNVNGNADTASSVAWNNVSGKPSGVVKVARWDGSTLSLTTAT